MRLAAARDNQPALHDPPVCRAAVRTGAGYVAPTDIAPASRHAPATALYAAGAHGEMAARVLQRKPSGNRYALFSGREGSRKRGRGIGEKAESNPKSRTPNAKEPSECQPQHAASK